MTNRVQIILWTILHLLVFSGIVLAWNDDITHRDISEYAAEKSTISQERGGYLNNLGFNKGIDEYLIQGLTARRIRDWIRIGSFYEDTGSRSLNHFHNPLKPWKTAGLADIMSGQSALLWAQSYNESQRPLSEDWSWQRTRKLYHLALSSVNPDARSMFFAETFRGIGHQMHLLQDMAVPSHVRNDAHPLDAIIGRNGQGSYFEKWTAKNPKTLPDLKTFAPNPIKPQLEFSTPMDNGEVYKALSPVTQLFDANMYDQSNPSTNNDRGLSEYTNANYFSDDTINLPNMWLSDGHEFPYPNATNTNFAEYLNSGATPTVIIAEDGISDFGFWIQKLTPNGDVDIIHFAKPGYFTNNSVGKTYDLKLIIPRTFILDDACHRDYAERLLPRAIGYSAALIDYFFRGQLGVMFAPNGIRVKNLSKEDMMYYVDPAEGNSVGSLEVFYDTNENTRIPLLHQPYQLASSTTPVIMPGQTSDVLSFDVPGGNIKPNRYIIVFRGKLGNEEGAVVGRVYVPTVYYFSRENNVDKFKRVEMDGSNTAVITDAVFSSLYLGSFSLSPDGNAIVFENLTDGFNSNILHYDLLTRTVTYLAEGNNPDWSPDGTKIVFSRELERLDGFADEQIIVRDLATGMETQLTDRLYAAHLHPAWSPDGNRIAYAKFNDYDPICRNDYTINVMTSSADDDTRLTCSTDNAHVDIEPAWSPDGSTIAFVRRTSGDEKASLHKVTVAGKTVEKLPNSDRPVYTERAPAWSPDGSAIAIGSRPSAGDNNYDVWLVNATTGAAIINLTEANPGPDGLPVFGK